MADPSVLVTCTVISVDDGLLRTSVGCDRPSFSLTLYVDWLNLTVMAMEENFVQSDCLSGQI